MRRGRAAAYRHSMNTIDLNKQQNRQRDNYVLVIELEAPGRGSPAPRRLDPVRPLLTRATKETP
jgi:hypothetical protein